MNEVKLKTKMELMDLIKFNYHTIIFGIKGGVFMIFIPLFMWLAVIFYFFGNTSPDWEFPIVPLMIAIFFTFVIPLLFFFYGKNKLENTRLKEAITYQLTMERIVVTGDSFIENLGWEKVIKFVETKSWFLIYTHEYDADIIRKKMLNESEIQETRSLVKEISNLQFKLLK